MIFVLQEKIFGDETDRLIEALKNNGIEYTFGIPDSVYAGGYYFPRGSIEFVEQFESKFGEFCTIETVSLDRYAYSSYAQNFGPRLLNDDFVLVPWWHLYHSNLFPEHDRLFIRPNSGRKIFTGTTLTKKWWKQELDIIKNLPSSSIKDNDLVVVAPYREILAEYRMLMQGDQLIDISRYDDEEEISFADRSALSFWAFSVDYQPDFYYTVDIAKTPESYKLVEINSAVSAGWYDMDYDKVVKVIKDRHDKISFHEQQ